MGSSDAVNNVLNMIVAYVRDNPNDFFATNVVGAIGSLLAIFLGGVTF